MQLCPYCGVEDYNLEGTCPKCGAPLPKPEMVVPQPPFVQYQVLVRPAVQPPRNPRSSAHGILTFIAIVVAVPVLFMIGCVVFIAHVGNLPPEDKLAGVASASGKWTVARGISHVTNSDALVAHVVAENSVHSEQGIASPILYCECVSGSLKVFIDAGILLSQEREGFPVTLTFDNGPKVKQYWSPSANNKGFQAKNAGEFMNKLQQSKSLKVGFTPLKDKPKEAVFDIRGFNEGPYQSLLKTCTKSF